MTSFPTDVEVRPAEPGDLPALHALLDRCSLDTRYRRFHGGGEPAHRRELERVARPTAAHRSWVAIGPDGEVHGTATLAWAGSGQADVAFLVEDAWFRRGLGRALFAAVAAEAMAAHQPVIVATILADNERAIRFLRAMAPRADVRYLGFTELEVTVPVAAVAAAPTPAEVAA
jgi:ribosomal protein S18 acetylase RimI-like enzyme